MIGFLHMCDLYPKKSRDAHEYLLMTWIGPSTGHSLGLPFPFPCLGRGSLGTHAWDHGTLGCRRKEEDGVAA